MLLARLLFSGLALILATGCATKGARPQAFTIAGGQQIELPIAQDGAPPTENADLRIEVTGFMLDEDRGEVLYAFGFTEKTGRAPQRVRVDDVTGPAAEILVIDETPALEKNYWKGTALPRKKGDPGLAWLTEDGSTIKIFRFTVTTHDGRSLVMHQAAVWPGDAKPLIRQLLGYDGPARRLMPAEPNDP